jgi:hypothetical protein
VRFQVPQFIEVEDKIFGPLTFRQFVYLAGGIGLCLLFWFVLPWKILAIPLILASAALSLSLAFLKVNQKPFIDVMQAAVYYALNHRLYIWKKEPKKINRTEEVDSSVESFIPKLSSSKLKEISWALDVEDLSKRQDSGK